jgi:hypothetical protein
MIASHWRIVFLLLQLGLIALTIAGVRALGGDPVDNPGVPK